MARCQGKTSSGSQCRVTTFEDADFCRHHEDQVSDPTTGPEEVAVREVEETPAARASPPWKCPVKGCGTRYPGHRDIAQMNHLTRVHGLPQK